MTSLEARSCPRIKPRKNRPPTAACPMRVERGERKERKEGGEGKEEQGEEEGKKGNRGQARWGMGSRAWNKCECSA
jgi:hypothetical protein